MFEFDSLAGKKQILIALVGAIFLEFDFFRGELFLAGELRTGAGWVTSVLLTPRWVGDILALVSSLVLLSFTSE